MRRVLKAFAFAYGCTTFIRLEPNCFEWSADARFATLVLTLGVWAVWVGYSLTESDKATPPRITPMLGDNK